MVQAVRQAGDERLDVCLVQGSPHLVVTVAIKRVQIHPDCPVKHHGILQAIQRSKEKKVEMSHKIEENRFRDWNSVYTALLGDFRCREEDVLPG
jgi:hypothetical protein